MKATYSGKPLISHMDPIANIVKKILEDFTPSNDDSFEKILTERVDEQLRKPAVRRNFQDWLTALDEFKNRLGKKRQQAGSVSEKVDSILKYQHTDSIALGCLQVMVFAYLPGPRYFKAVYIHSNIHDNDHLDEWKESFEVPHLNGALGWMTACSLNENAGDPGHYVTIDDAQLDLRGRVAVPDLWLGNRSVLGFPLSPNFQKEGFSSISGFIFFSHPIPDIFPNPTDKDQFATAFARIREKYESTLANSIESLIFRRYGENILKQDEKPDQQERTPLLKLSSGDPTGFLVSILFESQGENALSAECRINEDVFLRALAWHFRLTSIYPEKWDPDLVKQLRRIGKLIEIHDLETPPIVWYSLKPDSYKTLRRYFPHELSDDEIDFLLTAFIEPCAIEEPDSNAIKRVFDPMLRLLKLSANYMDQVDLVLPISAKEQGKNVTVGFYRINFDVSKVLDASVRERELQQMWRFVKDISDAIGKDIGYILLAIESEYLSIVQQDEPKIESGSVEKLRLLMDTCHLFNEWLANVMHTFFLNSANQDQFDGISEEMLKFALSRLSGKGASIIRKFDEFKKKLTKNLFADFNKRIAGFGTEVIFVSFWSLSRLPVLTDIEYPENERRTTDEDFLKLILKDPGFLRMLSILQVLLKPGQEVLCKRKGDGSKVEFGTPTSKKIRDLSVSRSHNPSERVLTVTWEMEDNPHSVKLFLGSGF